MKKYAENFLIMFYLRKKGCVNCDIVFLNVLLYPDAIKSLFFISIFFSNKHLKNVYTK